MTICLPMRVYTNTCEKDLLLHSTRQKGLGSTIKKREYTLQYMEYGIYNMEYTKVKNGFAHSESLRKFSWATEIGVWFGLNST